MMIAGGGDEAPATSAGHGQVASTAPTASAARAVCRRETARSTSGTARRRRPAWRPPAARPPEPSGSPGAAAGTPATRRSRRPALSRTPAGIASRIQPIGLPGWRRATMNPPRQIGRPISQRDRVRSARFGEPAGRAGSGQPPAPATSAASADAAAGEASRNRRPADLCPRGSVRCWLHHPRRQRYARTVPGTLPLSTEPPPGPGSLTEREAALCTLRQHTAPGKVRL